MEYGGQKGYSQEMMELILGGHYCISPFKYFLIYQRTNNVDAIRRLLGQSSVTATSAYLGVSDNSALDLARTINI